METCCSKCHEATIADCVAWDVWPAEKGSTTSFLCQTYYSYVPNILTPGCDMNSGYGLVSQPGWAWRQRGGGGTSLRRPTAAGCC